MISYHGNSSFVEKLADNYSADTEKELRMLIADNEMLKLKTLKASVHLYENAFGSFWYQQ